MPIVLLLPFILLVLLVIYNLLKIVYVEGSVNRKFLFTITKIVCVFYLVVGNILAYNKLSSTYQQYKVEQKRIQELVELGLKTEDLMRRIKEYKEQQEINRQLMEEYYNQYWKKYWEEHQRSA